MKLFSFESIFHFEQWYCEVLLTWGQNVKNWEKKFGQEWPRIDKTPSGSIPMVGNIPGESPKKKPPRLTLLSHHKLLRCRLSRILSLSALPNHRGAAAKGKSYALNILIEISSHNLSQVEKVNKSSTIKMMTINKTLALGSLFTIVNSHKPLQWWQPVTRNGGPIGNDFSLSPQ